MKTRKLCEMDRDRLLEYVSVEPEMNLFFFGDIENFGLESETVSAYAFSDGEDWDCVLLQYFDMYLIYSRRENFKIGAVAEFLREREVNCLSGKAELVRQFQPYFPEMSLNETYMCRCKKAGQQAVSSWGDSKKNAGQAAVSSGSAAREKMGRQAASSGSASREKAGQQAVSSWDDSREYAWAAGSGRLGETVEIRVMTAKDSQKIVELYLEIQEFARTYGEPEKAQRALEANFESGELVMGVFENGTLAAVAGTGGSNSRSAMVVGVATRPGFRKKGYATAVVKEVCRKSFEAGKEFLCLFYDNPEAGKIYRGIGFEEIGLYDMLR